MTEPQVNVIPEGTHTITPHIVVRNAARAAEWYAQALGAEERGRIPVPGGKFIEIELRFGDSTVMIADEFPEIGVLSPKSVGGTYGALHVATEDVDALWKRAVDAGAEVHQPLRELFWGDRHGQIIDPFGHRWGLSQHVRDVPPDEIARRGGGVRWLGLLQLRKPLKIRALVLRTVTDTLGPRSTSR